MKIFKFMAIALVAMLGFTACDNECEHELNKACGHEYIEVDYSNKLAGVWTCMDVENDYAEALIFSADGTVTSTGVFDGGLWEKKGTFNIKDNKMTLSFEDGDCMESRFEMVEGEVFSLVDDELDVHFNYYYCENDLSDEIVGMWICADGPGNSEDDMLIQVFNEDGSTIMTGAADELLVNDKSTKYKVIGDVVFLEMNKETVRYVPFRMTYSPNGTAFGDIMTLTVDIDDANIAPTATWLRVKQSLNLDNKVYDYISSYVTNAKGADEDFAILGNTFNISNINSSDLDMFFRSVLSCIELNDNTIKFTFNNDGRESIFNDPITVDGNKVTVDMSAENPAYRKVEMYIFQDADDCQLHIYMPTKSFINYFANLQIPTLKAEGELDTTDAAAVEKVFADMEARIESINVSFVLKARK